MPREGGYRLLAETPPTNEQVAPKLASRVTAPNRTSGHNIWGKGAAGYAIGSLATFGVFARLVAAS